jgi:Family of unknown function (DUF6069)
MNCAIRRLLTVGLAALAGLTTWFLLTQTAGVNLIVHSGGSDTRVGADAVVLVAVVVGLAGWGLLAFLERVAGRVRLIWTVIAAAVLALSLLGPLGGVSSAAVLALICLHLVVGLVLIAGLPRPATR